MPLDKENRRRAAERSRDSLKGAGWGCRSGTFEDLMLEELKECMPPENWTNHHSSLNQNRYFSWLNPVTWWRSRNDVIARFLSDPVNEQRQRRVTAQRQRPGVSDDFVIDRSDLDVVKFLVLGDPGEGDRSQWALVPPLLKQGKDTQFMVICSDVVYPAGDVNEYLQKFYIPYRRYQRPIYAVPGNHDWDDGDLNGFMVHFCGAEPSSEPPPWSNWVLRHLWRRPAKADPTLLERCRNIRLRHNTHEPDSRLEQPSPYFAIDTGPLRIVGIDTGITGKLDYEQGEWLRRVSSSSPKPKVLLTGKPIYVDNQYYPGCIEGSRSKVDDIVRASEHNYVAAIGGDTHNYQRYPVRVGNRTIQYMVSGGGGAYMSDTHRIPKVDINGVNEEHFRCYPLRGDSLSIYSRILDRRFFFGLGLVYIPPGEAAALMGQRLGIDPTRLTDRYRKPRRRKALAAKLPFLRTPNGFGGRRVLAPFFYPFFAEVFDWDEPPFFKNFLRLEATKSKLTITCYGVTGCAEHEKNPPKEDRIEIMLEKE
jgi:hypothetical protein